MQTDVVKLSCYADRCCEADVAFVVLQMYLKTQPSVIAWMQVECVQTAAVWCAAGVHWRDSAEQCVTDCCNWGLFNCFSLTVYGL
jgi:hypothetical protein